MMLLFDEGFIPGKLRKKLGRKIGDTIEQIYPNRKVCSEDKRPLRTANDLFYLFPFRVPARCALDQRHAREHSGLDIPADCLSRREIDRDIRAAHPLS